MVGARAMRRSAEAARPPARATELKAHAIEEARSAPHVSAVQVALRAQNLKQARAELDQVWAESIDYASLKRSYDSAESQEIDMLAIQHGARNHGCGLAPPGDPPITNANPSISELLRFLKPPFTISVSSNPMS